MRGQEGKGYLKVPWESLRQRKVGYKNQFFSALLFPAQTVYHCLSLARLPADLESPLFLLFGKIFKCLVFFPVFFPDSQWKYWAVWVKIRHLATLSQHVQRSHREWQHPVFPTEVGIFLKNNFSIPYHLLQSVFLPQRVLESLSRAIFLCS